MPEVCYLISILVGAVLGGLHKGFQGRNRCIFNILKAISIIVFGLICFEYLVNDKSLNVLYAVMFSGGFQFGAVAGEEYKK